METTSRNLLVVFCVGSVLLLGFNNCSNNFQLQEALTSSNSALGSNPANPSNPNTGGSELLPMPSGFSAKSLRVCASGCDYTLPSQAAAMVKDGEVIEIMSGDYNDCMTLRANGITVRGVGKTRPHLHSKLCDGKGIITNYASTVRLENIELSDFGNSDFNGAGIRQDVVAKDLIVSNFYFHDGQMGILGGSAGDRLRINATEFNRVGILRPDGEISVPIFVTAGASLQIRMSKFLNAVGGASFIKARSDELTIDCSVIANLESEDSYNVDYQTGGKLTIYNSVIEQSSRTQNATMVGINSVSYNAAITNSLTLIGNTFLNDAGRGTMVNIFKQTPSQIQVENNMFIGGGTLISNGTAVGPSNAEMLARPSSVGAYPSLPQPGKCITLNPSF